MASIVHLNKYGEKKSLVLGGLSNRIREWSLFMVRGACVLFGN